MAKLARLLPFMACIRRCLPEVLSTRYGDACMTALAVTIFLILVAGTAAGMVILSRFLGRKPLTAEKDAPYECGMISVERTDTTFPIHFYKVALLFVVFDIEVVFLYLWAVIVRDLGWIGLMEIVVFVAILLAAFFYAWRRGDLKWE
jgi:NADH-quinone oxidoreductase subunit A